jgi:ubiquinol-cytochrome c reductase cytochrome b subunit
VFGYTLVPNAFFGGALFPLIVFGLLYLWPVIERKITGDDRGHDLLDRPRDRPFRTATISAFFSWVAIVFLAGSQDQVALHFHISYVGLIWFFRIASIVVPFVVFFVVRAVARELQRTDVHPLRGWTGTVAPPPRQLDR